MSGPSFRGGGPSPRGRNLRGMVSSVNRGNHNPQPNFNQPRRESHVPVGEYWLEHAPPAPWQQINGLPHPQPPQFIGFESHRYRGRPQFCPGLGPRGRSKRMRGENRLNPGIFPTPEFGGPGLVRPHSEPVRLPPLGSEEERKQKIAETADKLKQKLSSLTGGEPIQFWENEVVDVSFSNTEEHLITSKGIPELRHDPPELNLTVNDFKDIGRVGSDNTPNSGDSGEMLTQATANSEEILQNTHPLDRVNPDHHSCSDNVNEALETAQNRDEDAISQGVDSMQENTVQHTPMSNCSHNNSPINKADQGSVEEFDYALDYNRNTSTPNANDEQTSNQAEDSGNDINAGDRDITLGLKQEQSKGAKKLPKVTEVKYGLDVEENARPPNDSGSIFQPNAGPRLQPDVRLDFHPGIGSAGVQRFQHFPIDPGPQEIRHCFRPPFRPEYNMEMHSNFRPDFHQNFVHGPDVGPRNFHPSPRFQGPRFSGRPFSRMPDQQHLLNPQTNAGHMQEHCNMNLDLPFDPREPPPRFNPPFRQDRFNRNEVHPKFHMQPDLGSQHPPHGFDPRGPPPRFNHLDHESTVLPPTYGSNIGASASVGPDYAHIVPPNYTHIPHMQVCHQPGFIPMMNDGFKPSMPPPNTAPCISPNFLPPSVPPYSASMDDQSMGPPPLRPRKGLEIPALLPPPPPPPPPSKTNVSEELSDQCTLLGNKHQNSTMDDELEDMQEALEFAKQLMNMTNEQDKNTTSDMPSFPDLPPVPSTEPSYLVIDLPMSPSVKAPDALVIRSQGSGDRGPETQKQGDKHEQRISVKEFASHPELLVQEDSALLDDLTRPKVVFNLNSRIKKITQAGDWQQQSDQTDARLREKKNNMKNKHWVSDAEKSRPAINEAVKSCELGADKTKGDQLFSSSKTFLEEHVGHTESEVTNVVNACNKTLDDKAKDRPSSTKSSGKSLPTSAVDANWKDKVMSQFLKMSKNDFCNMVNSSGLRKFDIAMKHLVKEQKTSLSQERRCSANDAVKSYDMSREEFMSQLNAMLDPSATVDVKNIPAKFIQHLSEVLKLDIESHVNDSVDSVDTAKPLESVLNIDVNKDNLIPDCGGNEEFPTDDKSKIFASQGTNIAVECNELLTETCDAENSCKKSPATVSVSHENVDPLPNMAVIDDIFTAGITRAKLAHKPSIPQKLALERRDQELGGELVSNKTHRPIDHSSRTINSEQNVDLDDIFSAGIARAKLTTFKAVERKTTADRKQTQNTDKCLVASDAVKGWSSKKRQDPDMFRNLTKEEWEAKYSKQADNCLDKESETPSGTPLSRDASLSGHSHSPRNTDYSRSVRSESRQSGRNQSPPTHLDEKIHNLNLTAMGINNKSNKWSKADENMSGTDSEDGVTRFWSSSSSNSDSSPSPNVTKLLKVIKEREKIAKNMSLNETIKHEVAAEIEFAKKRDKEEQREKKNRKYEKGKKKREHREKRSKRRNKNRSPETDEEPRSLLTTDELKDKFSIKTEPVFADEPMLNDVQTEELLKRSRDSAVLDVSKKAIFYSTANKNGTMHPSVSIGAIETQNALLTHSDNTISICQTIQQPKTPIQCPAPKLSVKTVCQLNDVKELKDNAKDSNIEGLVPLDNPFRKLDLDESRSTSSHAQEAPGMSCTTMTSERQLQKSGTKKIDINAYKARKMERNTENGDKSIKVKTPPNSLNIDLHNIPCSNQNLQSAANEIQNDNNAAEDVIPQQKDRTRQANSDNNVESGLDKNSSHNKKESASLDKSVRKGERKSNEDTIEKHKIEKVKSGLHDISEKSRTRNRSQDSQRSTSREDSHRKCKEKSKRCSEEKIDNATRKGDRLSDQRKSENYATHQNNNDVSKDKRTTKHKASNSNKGKHESIEKLYPKSHKGATQERTVDKIVDKNEIETTKKDDCGQINPGDVSQMTVIDINKEGKIQQHKKDSGDLEKSEKSILVADLYNEIPNIVTHEEISTDMSETVENVALQIAAEQTVESTSMDAEVEDKIGESAFENTQKQRNIVSLQDTDIPNLIETTELNESSLNVISEKPTVKLSNYLEEQTQISIMLNEIQTIEVGVPIDSLEGSEHLDMLQEEVVDDSFNNQGEKNLNDVRTATVTVLNNSEDNSVNEFNPTVTMNNSESENPLSVLCNVEDIKDDDSCEKDVHIVIQDLIDRVMLQLDLFGCRNENKDITVMTDTANLLNINIENESEILISSPTALELGLPEFSNYMSLEFSSPETSDSPLKGFTEESIKNSILGKRRLAESVFEITENFELNKTSQEFDDIILGMIAESDASAPVHYKKQETAVNNCSPILNVISAGSVVDATSCHLPESNVAQTIEDTTTGLSQGNYKDIAHNSVVLNAETSKPCEAPSGDTLSLGSSIDFDNGEFIVLSEVLINEDPQDDGRKSASVTTCENKGLGMNERKNGETNVGENNPHSSEPEEIKAISANEIIDDTLPTSGEFLGAKILKHTQLLAPDISGIRNDSIEDNKVEDDVQDLAKLSNKQDEIENSSQSLEMELHITQDNNMTHTVDIHAHSETNVSAEIQRDSYKQADIAPSEEIGIMKQAATENNAETLTHDDKLCAPSNCTLIPGKFPTVIDNRDQEKNSNALEAQTNKFAEQTKNLDVPTKDPLSSKNETNKDLHGVKRRHKTKHKKEKKTKLDEKKIQEVLKDDVIVTVVKWPRTKEGVLARMLEIDVEIHKLMSEKMKLYQMHESGDLPTDSLVVGADEPKLSLECIKASHRESESRPSNSDTSKSSTKHKSSSKPTTESHRSKSSKSTSTVTPELDTVSRNTKNHQTTSLKKRQKHHHERSSRKDNNKTETETISRISSSKRKNIDDKSHSKKRRSSRSSSRRREGDATSRSNSSSSLRHDERSKKDVGLDKTPVQGTVPEILPEACQKQKKPDNRNVLRKKTNKHTELRNDLPQQISKEGVPCDENMEVGKACNSPNSVSEKQALLIHSDGSSKVSACLEHKGTSKSTTQGPAKVDEIMEQDQIVPKECKGLSSKVNKERPKSSLKPEITVPPSQEEIPLNLRSGRKAKKKSEPLESVHSSSISNKMNVRNIKTKHVSENKVLEHMVEVINAVAENKLDEYQQVNKSTVKLKDVIETKEAAELVHNSNQQEIMPCTTAPSMDKVPDVRSASPVELPLQITSDNSEGLWPFADISRDKINQSYENLVDTLSDNHLKNFNESNDETDVSLSCSNSAAALQESDNRFPIDKIIEISRKNKEGDVSSDVANKNITCAVLPHPIAETEQALLIDNICEREMKDIHGDDEKLLCQQWNGEDVLQSSQSEKLTLDLDMTDIGPHDDVDATLIPQDPLPHSDSISRNIKDIEKGLDVLDSMLETVSSEVQPVTKDIASSVIKKRKRKRKFSKDRRANNQPPHKKKFTMSISEMMNCKVRLIDCKHTYAMTCLESGTNECAGVSVAMPDDSQEPEKSAKPTNPLKHNVTPSQTQNTEESHARTDNNKGPLGSQSASSKKPSAAVQSPALLLRKNELIDIEGNSEYDANDLEVLELHVSSEQPRLLKEHKIRKAGDISPMLSESGSRQSLDIATSECGGPKPVSLSAESSLECKTKVPVPALRVELRPRVKQLTKSIEKKIQKQVRIAKVDSTKESIPLPTSNRSEEEKVAQVTGKCEDEIQVIKQVDTREINEIEEIEPPRIQYSVHKGPILDVKIFGDSILAASEDGMIYRYSQTCNGILNTYEGHKSAVTCISILEMTAPGIPKDWLFSGSLDGSLRCFDIETGRQLSSAADVRSPIQCMDQSWGVLFLGTKSGNVSRFHIKSHSFRGDEIKFSEESVLALKATTEGPRRVLIVASRSQPITIRDAQSGLFLRTVSGHKSHTVYSLMMDSNLVYCGTSSTAIPVFDFINGSQVQLYNAGPGIVCMRMYKLLLFAGCYDGNIYVFDTKEQRLICSIPGPGNMLLSMDIIKNKIIAGSKDKRLHIWRMPEQVLAILSTRT